MRRRIMWGVCLGLLCTTGFAQQQIPVNKANTGGLAIAGPERIDANSDEYYDVNGLSVGDIKYAEILIFPREGVRTRTALPWGGGAPYIAFRAKVEGLYLLRVTIDHPPAPPATGTTRDPWVHVPDEHAEIIIQVGPPPPPPNPPDLSVTDVGGAESDEAVQFTVALSKPAVAAVSFDAATHDGEAKAGSDYQAVSVSGQIGVGQTTAAVTVPIINDEVSEQDESFSLVLSNVRNANVIRGSGTCILTDDDAPAITELSGVMIFTPDDESQQDPKWSQIMFGPRFNTLLGDRRWQPVARSLEGNPPAWIAALVERVKTEGLTEPQLFLVNQDHEVVWNGELSKDIDEVEQLVRSYMP